MGAVNSRSPELHTNLNNINSPLTGPFSNLSIQWRCFVFIHYLCTETYLNGLLFSNVIFSTTFLASRGWQEAYHNGKGMRLWNQAELHLIGVPVYYLCGLGQVPKPPWAFRCKMEIKLPDKRFSAHTLWAQGPCCSYLYPQHLTELDLSRNSLNDWIMQSLAELVGSK